MYTTATETWNVNSRHRTAGGKRRRSLPVTRGPDGRFHGSTNFKTAGTFGQVATERRPRRLGSDT
jgi:hypothetical protein